ncbi:S-protein homolog 5-like [Punica granatum]|uniref:S-protein homolog n=2 Tax=Punica granatum TaxID=22663 RepID=A0A218VX91_PUNGR|nr:S-protein homolog 5-like [Punica granatum]XP_031404494.1 S-protein homolog 5-like [Punica granatum]OWM65207.1 hypothetical protein CDL15_Pgr008796 [Punica granatum]PKI33761.1 hypothetical protein CRG98_045850 [Punica granatum]
MGSSPKHLIVPIVVVLSVLMDHTCEGQQHEPPSISDPGTVLIKIQNDVANNSATLTVHCRRVDRGYEVDLGAHDVAPYSYYKFSFETMKIPVTAYNCSFQWPPKNYHDFNIFFQARDGDEGENKWVVHDWGPCLRNTETGNEDCRNWS